MIALADTRELNNDDGRLVYRLIDEPATEELEHGDYLLYGNNTTMLVERVTNTGLLADIESGRMVDKLSGCAQDASIVVLIIEGLILPSLDDSVMVQENFFTNYGAANLKEQQLNSSVIRLETRITGWHYHAVMNFLMSTCLRWVHWYEFTLSPYHTAMRLLEISNYLDKDKHALDKVRHRPFLTKRGERDRKDINIEMLMALPGINTMKAESIVEHFGKAPLYWSASEKELRAVPGIGKKLAHGMIDVLE